MGKITEEKMKTVKRVLLFCFLAILLYIFYVGIHAPANKFTSDNFFMVAHTNLLKEQGFVHTEMLRMHEGLHFVIPQWLYAVVFTMIFEGFGERGIQLFNTVVGLVYVASVGLCIREVSKKGKQELPLLLSLIVTSWIFLWFCLARPFYITITALMLEVWLLEKWGRTKNWKYLLGLPVLSVLCINVHNSLWISLYLVLACYLAEELIMSIRSKQWNKERWTLLGLVCIGILAAAFINPYGWEYITYIFSSMQSISPFVATIGELQPLLVHSQRLLLLFFWILPLINMLIFRKHISLHFWFLWAGFALMALMNGRNLILLLSVGMMGCYQGASYSTLLEGKEKITHLVVLLFIAVGVIGYNTGTFTLVDDKISYQCVEYIVENTPESKEDTTVYSNVMDAGSLSTYEGLRPYIDGCAEIWGKANNGKKDYATEYLEVIRDEESFRNFLLSYQFDYLVLQDAPTLGEIAKKEGYRVVFEKTDPNTKETAIVYSIYK